MIPHKEARPVPGAYHALAAGFIALCVWLALRRPDAYSAAMQEDRVVEWLTVLAFGSAGIVGLMRAIRDRRVFDALVALFCLFVAGEEMSWGQRLLGMTPHAYFLEHNTQQEMNVHNFADIFGSPKEPFTLVLVGYGIILPLVSLTAHGRRLLDRIGSTPPPRAVLPWFGAAIILFTWYPFRFTGEWTELLAGSAFFAAIGVPTVTLLGSAAAGLAIASALAWWSARGGADPARVACASAEVRAIANGVVSDADGDLARDRSVHKRVWTLANEGAVDVADIRRRLAMVRCDQASGETRRRYVVDPWGTAYWLRVADQDAGRLVTVYSFGPNRRRDMDASAVKTGDDVFARVALSRR